MPTLLIIVKNGQTELRFQTRPYDLLLCEPSPLKHHTHTVFGTQCNQGLKLDRMVGDKAHTPFPGKGCNDNHSLHPCKPLAYTLPGAASEWKIRELGP